MTILNFDNQKELDKVEEARRLVYLQDRLIELKNAMQDLERADTCLAAFGSDRYSLVDRMGITFYPSRKLRQALFKELDEEYKKLLKEYKKAVK